MKPTLIYVPEFLGNETSFQKVDELLSYKGIRFAFSEELRHLDEFVEELQMQYDSVKGDKVLVGASMGTIVISKFIDSKKPENLKKLVLISPSENFSEKEKRLYTGLISMIKGKSEKDFLIDYTSHECLSLKPEQRTKYLSSRKTQEYIDKMIDLSKSFVNWDVSEENKRINLSKLLIGGEIDSRANRNKIQNLSFPYNEESKLVYVPNVGHAPQVDKPKNVARLMKYYLNH